MKVLLLNGSPRKAGCTFTALSTVAKALEENGIETEIFSGRKCKRESIKEAALKLKEADGLIVGSPVYWASPTGQIIEFIDEFSCRRTMLYTQAAAVTCARRAGTTATLDVLTKYFAFHQMPVISSNSWNMVHGNTPEEVCRTRKGCRLCEFWEKTWHGC